MFSQTFVNDMISAFTSWLASDAAAPKGDQAVVRYLFEVLHMSADEQQAERKKWLTTVKRSHERSLVDIDESAARTKKAKEDDLAAVQVLLAKLDAMPADTITRDG